jgi:hypothetical protein
MGEPVRKPDSAQAGPYRESYDSLKARCEALNKENMQLQWKLIQQHHRFKLEIRNLREQTDRRAAEVQYMGNIIGELSDRARQKNGMRRHWLDDGPTPLHIAVGILTPAVLVVLFLAAAVLGWV